MAIIPQEEKKTKPTFVYSIAALLATAVFLSLAIFFWPVRPQENYKETVLNRDERKLSDLTFNLAILETPVFKELKLYGEFPITVIEGGRPNPFSL
jgi:hypothetical protein